MSPEKRWEPRSWGGAYGLREERSRARGRLRRIGLILAVFVYALLQVRMNTEVARLSSSVQERNGEVKRLEVDLTVARDLLAQRRIYGELLAPAALQGFAPGSQHRLISILRPVAAAPADVWTQLGHELQRGTDILLPSALAQEVWAKSSGRADSPGNRGRSDRLEIRGRAERP